MSDYENWNGKLTLEIPLDGETLEEQKKRICFKYLDILKDGPEAYYEDMFGDELFDIFIVIKNKILRIDGNDDKDDDGTHCEVTKVNDKEYTFSARFYNGGTCLAEMLEDAFTKQKLLGSN